jgi:DNA methylase
MGRHAPGGGWSSPHPAQNGHMRSPWYIVVRGNASDLARIKAIADRSSELSLERGGRRLDCSGRHSPSRRWRRQPRPTSSRTARAARAFARPIIPPERPFYSPEIGCANGRDCSYHDITVTRASTSLRDTLDSRERVRGLTHSLYRYPARFSPAFAGQAIEEFASPNGLVLDPFLGGGTTAVEALARGRRFVGFDLNSLSLVLTRAKTTPLSAADERRLLGWASSDEDQGRDVTAAGELRLRNAPGPLVKALAPFVAAAGSLATQRQRDAARALLLSVGQWAVDGRAEPADPLEAVLQLRPATEALIGGLRALGAEARRRDVLPSDLHRRRALFLGPASRLAESRPTNRLSGRAELVLTSPPYPGVHVLYHRWQVRGRSETPMPYWLADAEDGLGARHYTMGGRSHAGEEFYFSDIEATWRALRRLLSSGATVIQVVAFASPDRQLPRYLAAMVRAGYEAQQGLDEPLWRSVPNRRWYYRVRPERGEVREVLLIHRKVD